MKNKGELLTGKGTIFISMLSIAMLLFGCMDDDESALERQIRLDDEAIVQYLEDNDIEAQKTVAGYYFVKDVENGGGEAVADGDIVSIYYRMSLLNGNKVDSAVSTQNAPVKMGYNNDFFTLLPSGLNIGIGSMRVGEVYRFFIPSNLAFSGYSYKQLIPANAIFIVEVELAGISDNEDQELIEENIILAHIQSDELGEVESLSSGLFFQTLSAGSGTNPKNGNRVEVHYTGRYLNGPVFDKTESNRPFAFIVGNNSTIPGFEEGVKKMKKGETALLIIPSHLAYGESLQVLPEQIREDLIDKRIINNSLLPFSILEFEVEVVDIF